MAKKKEENTQEVVVAAAEVKDAENTTPEIATEAENENAEAVDVTAPAVDVEPVVTEATPEDTAEVVEESTAAEPVAEEENVAAKSADVLTGTFKVYRGRNIATITAMTSVVICDGDAIVENGVKWMPVRFNNKAGVEARGFIIVK